MHGLFVLGAKDPEMDRIEEILKQQSQRYIHAKIGGRRVHAGNAYHADNAHEIPFCAEVIFVECEIPGIRFKTRIDHHRPGDPGYEKDARHYWEGSSLGQLHIHLGITERSPADCALAAMDHCFNQAMQGYCPGANPGVVLARNLFAIADSFGITLDEVNGAVNRLAGTIREAPVLMIGGYPVRLLPENLGVGYTLEQLAAYIAAALEDEAILIRCRNEENGPEKVVLRGNVDTALVRYFMQTWAPAEGIIEIYGCPERGYAGGFLPARGEETNPSSEHAS